MSLRFADFQALLLAGMVCGLLPAANAQTNGGSQRIVFSSPEGQITTNASIPMAQAPAPAEKPDLPAGGVVVHEFSEPVVGPIYPLPLPVLQPNARKQNDSLDPRDIRKQMGELTPGQIMNVPTVEQIFGLPEKKPDAQKEPWQLDSESDNKNGATNNLNSDTTAIIAEPSWAKLWSQGAGKNTDTESSNTTDRASGFFSRFFDNSQSDSAFGNHDSSGNDSIWGSGQSAPQQSSWDSGFAAGPFTRTTPVADAGPNNFAPPTAPTPILASQSPFAAPQLKTLATMPKLPSLPSLPGQSSQLPQAPSTPSWTPQPPPWTQSQTPFGTPVPVNPALKR